MRVLAPGEAAQRLPGLDRDLAVGLGRQRQDHLGGVDVGLDLRQPLGRPLVGDDAVQALRKSTSCSVFQAMPLPPLPSFDISGPSDVKRL